MGPLFLVGCDQKRVQYYSFLGKNPNDFSLNHMRINLNIAMAFIVGCGKYHICVISVSKLDLYLCIRINTHASQEIGMRRITQINLTEYLWQTLVLA